jgi:hypothetical protein
VSDLRRMQEKFYAALSDGEALDDFAQIVNDSSGLSGQEHVKIYRRAIIGTLLRALASIYPVCQRLVGDAFFAAMTRRFIQDHASVSADLADYGEGLPEFIRNFSPASDLPYLADVARLEWHWHRAFNAVDQNPLDPVLLAQVPQADVARIHFRLADSTQLLTSDFPVHRIWQINQDDWTGASGVNLDEGGVQLIIGRQERDLYMEAIDDKYWWLLNELNNDVPLGAISASPLAIELDELLPHCVARGWIGGFEIC